MNSLRNTGPGHGRSTDRNSPKPCQERFGVDIEFDEGRIVYKETIADVVEGVGHFEP